MLVWWNLAERLSHALVPNTLVWFGLVYILPGALLFIWGKQKDNEMRDETFLFFFYFEENKKIRDGLRAMDASCYDLWFRWA